MSALDERDAGHPIHAGSQPLAEAQAEPRRPRGTAATFTRNSILSVSRVLASALIAFILPSYLTHKLPVQIYSAWVLILQVSAYVAYLEFGIQSGISKFVAEYEARNDATGASVRASAGLALMVIASAAGVVLTLILAWQVPRLFTQMPVSLYRDVRLSIIFVGISLSFGLLSSVFASIFFGLQRYTVPILLSIANRILYTVLVLAAVAFHQSLAIMGALVAIANAATGLLQFEAWRRLARNVRLTLRGLDLVVVKTMFAYCSSLAIWTAGMLCVSGLDVTIVGRYDFGQTAFYAIAVLPTNFMSSIIGAAISPLMPTASALSVHRSSSQMGELLSKVTRYTSTLLLISGLPLLVGGFWILKVWVGPMYATNAIGYLRILVLANLLRNVCMPYASMLVATDSQKIAIAGAVAEALVNVGSSIYLARHVGAIGVAYGTLLGSTISVGAHFALNMHYTKTKFAISRVRLFIRGIALPCAISLPSVFLIHRWWSRSQPDFGLQAWLAWGLSTVLIAWFVGLNREERGAVVSLAARPFQPAYKI